MKKILIIDDDLHVLEYAKTILSMHFDAEILTATSGREGLKAVAANTDLSFVICDYQMPGGSGLWVREEIEKVHPDLPFLLHTNASEKARKEFARWPDVAFVEKFDFVHLTLVLSRVLPPRNPR